MKKRTNFETVGIIFSKHGHMQYGAVRSDGKRGFGLFVWMPYSWKRAIVNVWNPIICALFGHDIFGPFTVEGHVVDKTCSACSKKWPSK